MAEPLLLLSLAGGVAAVTWVAARERRRLFASRRAMLTACAAIIDDPVVMHEADGFPRLKGSWRGSPVILSLFPDTLTPRRLPQLWLSLTCAPLEFGATPVLDILVRPTGAEAYSYDAAGLDRFEPPPGLSAESLIRGEGDGARRLLSDLAAPLAALFSDPRVKEITFTPRATRLIWQAAEGDRGNHLILRQATFETVSVTPEDIAVLLSGISALANARSREEHAA